jgi:hypothetical protein
MLFCMQEHSCVLEEWTFPTTTLWSEHKHLGAQSPGYSSKMDAFREVVDRAKLKSLSLSSLRRGSPLKGFLAGAPKAAQAKEAFGGGGSQRASIDLSMEGDAHTQRDASKRTQQGAPAVHRVWVLSDFPHVNNPDSCEQLRELLTLLAHSVRTPLAVLVTEPGGLSLCSASTTTYLDIFGPGVDCNYVECIG